MCGVAIHRQDTVTWVDERAVHVVCYKPGSAKKTASKPAPARTSGLRDGRKFVPSEPAPAQVDAPALEVQAARA